MAIVVVNDEEAAADGSPDEVLGALRHAEKAQVLDQLLAARPELRAEAAALARHLLLPKEKGGLAGLQERTATEVEEALRSLDIANLRAGYQPGVGYVEEHQAAADLVGTALEPFEDDVRRRLALGFTDAAEAVALGVLDGLDACEEEEWDGEAVLSYAGEELAETYGYTVRALMRKVGREPD